MGIYISIENNTFINLNSNIASLGYDEEDYDGEGYDEEDYDGEDNMCIYINNNFTININVDGENTFYYDTSSNDDDDDDYKKHYDEEEEEGWFF